MTPAVIPNMNSPTELTTQDGQPLKKSLARALRREKLRAMMLIAPLLLFVLASFILPIGDMLFRSVENSIVERTLPGTVRELAKWDAGSGKLPDEAAYAVLADDMMVAQELKIHTRLGSRLNYNQPGISSVFRKSGRKVKQMDDGVHLDAFAAVNPDWAKVDAWRALRANGLWPDAFPRTAIAWSNWERYVASEEGLQADPDALLPYGFTYSLLYHDLLDMPAETLDTLVNGDDAALASLFQNLNSG